MTDTDSHELDLPLSANINDIDISHFILHLSCDLDQKILSGDITLFCRTLKRNSKTCKRDKTHVTTKDEDKDKVTDTTTSGSHDILCEEICLQIGKTNCNSSHFESLKDETDHTHGAVEEKSVNSETVQDETRSTDGPDIILDSHSLIVRGVEELTVSSETKQELLSATRSDKESKTGVYMKCYSQRKSRPLDFSVGEHKITIFGQGSKHFQTNLPNSNMKYKTDILLNDTDSKPNPPPVCINKRKSGTVNPESSVVQEKNKQNENSSHNDTELCTLSGISCSGQLKNPDISCESRTSQCMDHKGLFRIIRIFYTTKPEGPSLKWTLNQDGRPCMFTVGHWLNNRSWFPSQDAPSAMPTWQAVVTVADHLTVLMSGDTSCQPTVSEGYSEYYYYSTMPMPSSTLAIAVGTWIQVDASPANEDRKGDEDSKISPCLIHRSNCPVNYAPTEEIPCRIFTAECLIETVRKELAVYVPRCLRVVYDILGQHPFQRLDVLVVPQCFDSLGMASPSLLFLSQSLLVGDFSMCARVAHEICHSWFGLLIGPCDWTEEWLTEGFCTYLEDIVHAKVSQWNDTETVERTELRALLKQKTLLSEVENTEVELQTLRPNQGEQLLSACDSSQYVKNGMNPDKAYTQVHYLKGYFLLKQLENLVGQEEFLVFLHQYVDKFHAQLVTSQNVFEFFFKKFPHLKCSNLNEEQLTSDWLDCPGVHQDIKFFKPSLSNKLWNTVEQQISSINLFCVKTTVKKKKKQKLDVSGLRLEMLNTDQLVVLLEELLQMEHIPGSVLDLLLNTYHLGGANPEIRHRWCELVVKHHHRTCYHHVKDFLLNDQAMGVYLYGEMVLSGCKQQKDLAVECFESVKQDMPQGACKTITSMLYGR